MKGVRLQVWSQVKSLVGWTLLIEHLRTFSDLKRHEVKVVDNSPLLLYWMKYHYSTPNLLNYIHFTNLVLS